MNDAIRAMLASPGRHAVSNSYFHLHGLWAVVEVEPDGTCHQLNPRTGQRDGVLPADGWTHNACVVPKERLQEVAASPRLPGRATVRRALELLETLH